MTLRIGFKPPGFVQRVENFPVRLLDFAERCVAGRLDLARQPRGFFNQRNREPQFYISACIACPFELVVPASGL